MRSFTQNLLKLTCRCKGLNNQLIKLKRAFDDLKRILCCPANCDCREKSHKI